jgi:putative ATPase
LALVVADAAARAVEFVGLPEAQLNLAEAVVYLATAPKSNRVTVALGRAQDDVRSGPRGDVPPHLRDRHAPQTGTKDDSAAYRYPHHDPRGWVEQEYRPAAIAGNVYYEPSGHGAEAELAERLRNLRQPATDTPSFRDIGGPQGEGSG